MQREDATDAVTSRAKSRLKSIALGCLAFLVFFVGLGALWWHNANNIHRHCMKVAGLDLRLYASDHDGKYPYHTNGFGDALIELARDYTNEWEVLSVIRCMCGPGDDGSLLRSALTNGTDVPEALCSRIYVQGLTETNDPQICLLFDRLSVPGGDHRYGFGRPVRELCLVDGSMRVIDDARWPEFSREQVELLVKAGWSREKALELYPEARTNSPPAATN